MAFLDRWSSDSGTLRLGSAARRHCAAVTHWRESCVMPAPERNEHQRPGHARRWIAAQTCSFAQSIAVAIPISITASARNAALPVNALFRKKGDLVSFFGRMAIFSQQPLPISS
jgi:hypothetical protein